MGMGEVDQNMIAVLMQGAHLNSQHLHIFD